MKVSANCLRRVSVSLVNESRILSSVLDLVSKTCRDKIAIICKDVLGHTMILDLVSKTCRDMKLSCSES